MSPNVPPGPQSTADARCATGSSTSGPVVRPNWQQILEALDEYAAARRRGDFDVAVIYAGQGAALLQSETTAAEVVNGFVVGV